MKNRDQASAGAEKKTPMLVRDITVQKTDIMAEAEVSRKLKDNRVLTMKNNRLTMECSRIEIETNALRLKIDQINDLIANVDEEARLDKEAIDALEEEKREVTTGCNWVVFR